MEDWREAQRVFAQSLLEARRPSLVPMMSLVLGPEKGPTKRPVAPVALAVARTERAELVPRLVYRNMTSLYSIGRVQPSKWCTIMAIWPIRSCITPVLDLQRPL